MTATRILLDRWKAAKSIPSDNAAALELGITRQAVSRWRQTPTQAEPNLVARMAHDLGDDAGKWLALVESERARSDADRKVWAALARQLGAAATLAAVALLPFPGNATSRVSSTENALTGYTLCEVLRRILGLRRMRQAFARAWTIARLAGCLDSPARTRAPALCMSAS